MLFVCYFYFFFLLILPLQTQFMFYFISLLKPALYSTLRTEIRKTPDNEMKKKGFSYKQTHTYTILIKSHRLTPLKPSIGAQ